MVVAALDRDDAAHPALLRLEREQVEQRPAYALALVIGTDRDRRLGGIERGVAGEQRRADQFVRLPVDGEEALRAEVIGLDHRKQLRVADVLGRGEEAEATILGADLVEERGKRGLVVQGGSPNCQLDPGAGGDGDHFGHGHDSGLSLRWCTAHGPKIAGAR